MFSSSTASSSVPFGIIDPHQYLQDREAAVQIALDLGFDPSTFTQVPVNWGDQDPNNHLNNAVYFKFLETGRTSYIRSLTSQLDPSLTRRILSGRTGKGLVVGEVRNRFEKAVYAPDHLLIAHRAESINSRGTSFTLQSLIVSFSQRTKVCSGSAIMFGFDYDTAKGSELPQALVELIRKELAQTEQQQAKTRNVKEVAKL